MFVREHGLRGRSAQDAGSIIAGVMFFRPGMGDCDVCGWVGANLGDAIGFVRTG